MPWDKLKTRWDEDLSWDNVADDAAPEPKNYFDDSYWVAFFGSWAVWDDVNNEWDSAEEFETQVCGIIPAVASTWDDGYDPQNVEITLGNIGGGGSDDFNVTVVFTVGDNVTFEGVTIANGVPYLMDLSAGGDTPSQLVLTNAGTVTGTFSITNIWFDQTV